MKSKDLLNTVVESMIDTATIPSLNLGLDLDGTISEKPEYFRMLSNMWSGNVFVITYRSDYDKAKKDVEQYGIRYNEIILVRSFDAKAEVIREKNINVYYDDQPEMIANIPDNVQVFLVRNGGNFDYENQKWMMSDTTAKII